MFCLGAGQIWAASGMALSWYARRSPAARSEPAENRPRDAPSTGCRGSLGIRPPILRYASTVWYSRVGSQNFDPWKIQRDPDDLPEVCEVPQIAGVMPPEVPVPRAMDERAHGFDPARIGQAGEPLLHRRPDHRKQVPAAHGIAVVADGLGISCRRLPEPASMRRQRIPVAGHLAGVAE